MENALFGLGFIFYHLQSILFGFFLTFAFIEALIYVFARPIS